MFCVIDVLQFNFTKRQAYCLPSRSDFLTNFEELSTECLRNTVTEHCAKETVSLKKNFSNMLTESTNKY